jgi:hypothetical protein
MTDEAGGREQTLHSLLDFFFRPRDGNIDAERFATLVHDDLVDSEQTYSRIAKFSAENRDQFFLEGLDATLLMMLLPATFHLNSIPAA